MVYWIVALLLGNSLLAIPVAYVASAKGRSAAGFYFLSFFLSFLVGILVILALPKLELEPSSTSLSGQFARSAKGDLFKCPYCAEWVKIEANVCRFCGKDISAEKFRISNHEADLQRMVEADRQSSLRAREIARQEKKDAWKIRRSKPAFWIIGGGLVATVVGVIVGIVSQAQRDELAAQQAELAAQQAELAAHLDWSGLAENCVAELQVDSDPQWNETFEINADNTQIRFETYYVMDNSWLNCMGEQIAVDKPNNYSGENEFYDSLGWAIYLSAGGSGIWSSGGLGTQEADFGNLHLVANRTNNDPDHYSILITKRY